MKNKKHLPLFGVGPIYAAVCVILTVVAVNLGQQDFAKAGIIPALKIPSLITGIILTVFGIFIWCGAVFHAKLDASIIRNKLVTTGVYGLVRNPIYSAFMFACTGVLFISGNVFFYPLFFFFWAFMTVLMINTEEKWLEKTYGDEYREYKKKVNRCIPWKRSRK
ncbi:MAG: isoprenylcysteine carboxylmethyltransferase family protein [Oscillospiraceae bacterium]|nr:isoprenylcysteine carboxylmethyltransferase family protein [Oscillospiraceae bacterium]